MARPQFLTFVGANAASKRITPAWLPSGAVAFADFVNGRYYAGGAAVAVADMFGDNSDYPGLFDAAQIAPSVGYAGRGDDEYTGGTAKAALLSAILGGATIVHEFSQTSAVTTSGTSHTIAWELYSSDYATQYTAAFSTNEHRVYQSGGEVAGLPLPAVGRNIAAFTVVPATKLVASLNGSALASIALTAGSVSVVNWIIYGSQAPDIVTKQIVVYPVRPDADLPALSAL